MNRYLFILALCVGSSPLPTLAGSEAYVPYSGIIRGTDGAAPVVLTMVNHTEHPLVCQAALAHWYSEDLGSVVVDGSLEVALWHDPETGVTNLLNDSQDRMPVEALWCGTLANLRATRTRIDLPMQIGPAEPTMHFECTASDDERIRCSLDQI